MNSSRATRRVLLVSDVRSPDIAAASPGVRRFRLARPHGERRQPLAFRAAKTS